MGPAILDRQAGRTPDLPVAVAETVVVGMECLEQGGHGKEVGVGEYYKGEVFEHILTYLVAQEAGSKGLEHEDGKYFAALQEEVDLISEFDGPDSLLGSCKNLYSSHPENSIRPFVSE